MNTNANVPKTQVLLLWQNKNNKRGYCTMQQPRLLFDMLTRDISQTPVLHQKPFMVYYAIQKTNPMGLFLP